MSITKEKFGTLSNGEEVYLYTLSNNNGLSAEIISFGGIIKSLFFTKNGEKVDVVLGRDTLDDYLINKGHYGAAIGRHANRIANSEFQLNGKTYKVGANEGKNSLHGGIIGYDKRNWQTEEAGTPDEPSLILKLFSPDGEEGFPGNLELKMTYTLSKNNGFIIHYEATSDADTVANFTNHSYFNLNGHASGTIYNHILQMDADFYTPNTSECIPNGEVLSVKGTPFDFTTPKALGKDIKSELEQIKMFGGYDHNFVLKGRGFRRVATLEGDKTGIVMQTYTDKPAIQIYSGNWIKEDDVCKGNNKYKVHGAVCLETQFFPAGTTYSHFPSPFLKKGEKYDYTTEYRFS